jgi:arsenical pump membrane protein
MMVSDQAAQATWGIATAAAGRVIFRPWKLPEAVWAVLGAGALIGFGLLPWNEALGAIPAALIAGSALGAAHAPALATGAVLIGVDLGPNLSITGSLATTLWLVALRRKGEAVGALRFLRLSLLVMTPALLLALAAAVLSSAA